ncbi:MULTISPECIES: 3-hydroxyacyl-ACP dehydratase FabZ [Craterilacuibacter]|uniref:3-hydroxyacyl-[acyl-carrier-protein] dehydratase FabZ n=1 Tax=Craterilacuibacter sinensis TaxID=2686017 RepID=A0A845BNG5_9NEIS|nr:MULTISPECIES: 3-hydroxyacyl-ACP dehydratase FabZ [Craterilacuibacter]MCL6262786.1 3-hydroxyacyl-ACP dehydratase FabZ [Craterilacuibacter sp. RT1T]MXR36940.1 3-hydroxyacyl-ACP dehydratase FabZ [Craterilacuibacter sinensis]
MSEEVTIDVREIMRHLPHRYPFLLVDRVTEFEPGKRIKALKNVTINEPFFVGHFGDYPVMPGVLIIEALAQAAGVLSIKSAGERKDNELYFFVGIDNARFKRQVVPGDQLVLEVEQIAAKRGIAKYTARALVDGQVACEAEIMCAKREV